MKKIIKISLVILVLFSVSTSCKKYTEGPMISFRSKKARVSGDWKIEQMTVNGSDVTSTFQTLVGADYVLDIEKDGKYHVHGLASDEGTWKLGEDGDDIYMMSSKTGALEQSLRILKLKNKELWLRQTAYNGDITIVHYEPAD